jgi:arylsulfatase A-like enzyme
VCLACASILYFALAATLRLATEHRSFAWLLRPWGTPALVVGLVAVLVPATLSFGPPARAALPAVGARVPDGAGNVLVVVVDTLRADHLPAYGYQGGRTPNLDAFARDAIRFDQAFSNASWTRPSFASILSGRYPSSHGVMAKTDALPNDLTTLAEAYREGGFHTIGIVTNYNVAPYFNFDQGFDDYHYLSPDFVLGADDSAAKLLLVQFLRQRIEGVRDRFLGVRPGTAYQDAETVNRRLLAAIDAAPSDRPWLTFVGYMDPHDPYYAHPYDGEAYSRAAHPSPAAGEAEHLRALYDGEITYWDEHFGRLVAELRRRGLYDDLTIVVTSDHGEEFGEHGGFFHGTTLYDEQVRVPLFVKLPASRRGGTTVRHWVQSIDLMPTLLRESGLEVPAGVQGGDLFTGSDRLFAEESHEGNVLEAVRERRGTDEIKLITANEGNPRRLPTAELFRVDLDPGEREDLARAQPELLEHARRALEAARAQASQGAVRGQEVELDDASRRQLCELGYLTGEACER